jgi:hypothetical protein
VFGMVTMRIMVSLENKIREYSCRRGNVSNFSLCFVNIALGHVNMTRIWDENFRVCLVDRRKRERGKNSGGK